MCLIFPEQKTLPCKPCKSVSYTHLLIGLGGSAASSMDTGSNIENLDFDSVQRGNPELERRAQEVIDRCWQLGDANPILSIHDVGAGGISNAFPELVNDAGVGATFQLRDVHNEEPGMSPRELWSNEAQERYVMAIAQEDLPRFKAICAGLPACCGGITFNTSAFT